MRCIMLNPLQTWSHWILTRVQWNRDHYFSFTDETRNSYVTCPRSHRNKWKSSNSNPCWPDFRSYILSHYFRARRLNAQNKDLSHLSLFHRSAEFSLTERCHQAVYTECPAHSPCQLGKVHDYCESWMRSGKLLSESGGLEGDPENPFSS